MNLNVCAVTGSFEGGENRKPLRMVNVYVFPPSDGFGSAAATSGSSREMRMTGTIVDGGFSARQACVR